MTPLIVNGQDSEKGQFPYQALIYTNFGNCCNYCSGVIISAYTILTAAHCMRKNNTDPIYSFADVGVYSRESWGSYQSRHTFSSVLIHEGYNYSAAYDIALITLQQKIKLNECVMKIALPTTPDNYAGSKAVISGWGITEHNESSNVLRYTMLPVIDNNLCGEKLGNSISTSIICFLKEEGRETGIGDSGGPWTAINHEGKPVLIGIHTFSGNEVLGAVRVSSVFRWIIQNCKNVCGIINDDE